MPVILETDRLLLKEFEPVDAAFIVQLVNTEGWLKYIGDRNIKTIEKAEHYLVNGPIKSYRQNGYGLYKVEKKDTHQPIGMCGIIKREHLPCPDIGFAFLPEFCNQGFAFEIATATMDFAKEELSLPVIAAITVPQNERSVRLLKKLGLSFQEKIKMPGSQDEVDLYDNNHGRNE
jgi:RimJ/RimL family protein N-acetyltransferase